MTHALDGEQAARDLTRERFAVREREQRILGAVDHERWRRDLPQTRAQGLVPIHQPVVGRALRIGSCAGRRQAARG
jgi:hypothetical protein